MNLIFWNTAKKKLDDALLELLVENNCDMLILAEYPFEIKSLCTNINIKSKNTFVQIPNYSKSKRLKGIVKIEYNVDSIREQSRYQIISLSTTSFKVIIGMIHNISKNNKSNDTQEIELRCFHKDITEVESELDTNNTLLIGDFNANPFEKSCIAASTLHAIPYIEESNKISRIINSREYDMFYNPMWKLFGTSSPPYATYFYDNSGNDINYYWNLFDQVIIRPQLIPAFKQDSLKIISQTKNYNFLKKGKPNKIDFSDHLPIYCELKEEKII